jgi:hypothetical protein
MYNTIRYEEGTLTLRLFPDERSSRNDPDYGTTLAYFCGFIGQTVDGRWYDGGGLLPDSLQPSEHGKNAALGFPPLSH